MFSVLVTQCGMTSHPKTKWLKTINIYCVINLFAWVTDSELLSSWFQHRVSDSIGRAPIQLIHVSVGRPGRLLALWASLPFLGTAQNMAACVLECKIPETECLSLPPFPSPPKKKLQAFSLKNDNGLLVPDFVSQQTVSKSSLHFWEDF